MQVNHAIRPDTIRAAKYLFAIYCGSSKGLTHDGRAVPTWDQIVLRAQESQAEKGIEHDPDGIDPGYVPNHWCAVAEAAGNPTPPAGDQLAMTLDAVYNHDGEKAAAFHRYYEP